MSKRLTVYGYDGNGYGVGDRVELHPGCDLWMQGARYGTVAQVRCFGTDRVSVKLDRFPSKRLHLPTDRVRRID